MSESSKVTIHMVSSLDGYVAKNNGDVSWMRSKDNHPEGKTLTEEEIAIILNGIDCYVMGSKTYKQALELGWPYGDKPVVVLSNRAIADERENVTSYSGDIKTLINDQLKPIHKNIWMVGGPTIAKKFIKSELVDEIIVSIMPIILGDGSLLFDCVGKEQQLHLKENSSYTDGMVELTYSVVKA